MIGRWRKFLRNAIFSRRRSEPADIALATAVAQADEGVVITDGEARIQYVNGYFTRMTGYTAAEAIGQNPRVLKSGLQDAAFYKQMWETIRAGQVWRGELTNRRRDGTVYAESMTITPVRNSRGAITNYIAIKQDVTGRRRAERAQATLAAIVESSQDAIFSHTLEGTITSWNRGAALVYGYTAPEAIGMPVSMLIAPDRRVALAGALEELRAGKAFSQVEVVGIGKRGERIDVCLSSSPIEDAGGNRVAVAVIVRDIGAQKQAERALRQSEEQFRAVFTHSPAGMALTAPDGHILKANAVLCGILGCSCGELMAKDWLESIHPDDIGRSRQLCDRFRQTPDWPLEFETRCIHKQGNAIPVRIRISTVRDTDGSPCYYIVHVEDITESKRTEQALRASEERYRLLFSRSMVGVMRTTSAGRILDCNQAVAQMLACESPAELIGGSILDYHYSIEDRDRLLRTLRQEGALANTEWKLRRRDGKSVWVLANITFMDEEQGGILEVALIDIGHRKRVEAELREAKEAAEEASRAKSSFLANMSHEIRTPMNSILGMIGLILDADLDQRQRKRAETVRDSAEALLSILNDLLEFSKMEAGKLQLEEVAFDLRNLVEGVADLMAVRAQEKKLELLCFIEPDVPTSVLGDAGRLRQVLGNLAGNAVKFTAAGEVSIRVKLQTAGNPGAIRFEVRDTGIGIPADKQHLLFQLFSQVDASTARRYGGTGLGLSIVRMLVEMMGGSLSLESAENEGSCFGFTLPLKWQATVERPRVLSLAGRNILVVDDNAASRSLLMELLAFWKTRAAQAGDASTALGLLQSAAANADPFDAVVVDLEMPGIDGAQVGALIQRCPGLARTPVVLLTPLSQSTDVNRWRRMGFAAHAGKPVKQGELGNCLASILSYGPAPVRAGLDLKAPRTDRQRRAQLRLLVVEDNKINQEVALGILENLGYRADVADDGHGAIAALGREDYDLVLMDCQMPGMDGYEATRRIRLPDTPVRNHGIPIIAATAHAMAGDRKKCLAAGMNGYVSKPLRPGALEKAIEEWTSIAGVIDHPALLTEPETAASPDLFDREDFVDRVMGNEELAQRVIHGFVEDMPRQLALLAEAVDNRDAGQVQMVAHSIKGAAANVSGLEVREAAWKLEQQGTAGDLTSSAEALRELSASVVRVKPILESFCRKRPDVR